MGMNQDVTTTYRFLPRYGQRQKTASQNLLNSFMVTEQALGYNRGNL